MTEIKECQEGGEESEGKKNSLEYKTKSKSGDVRNKHTHATVAFLIITFLSHADDNSWWGICEIICRQ